MGSMFLFYQELVEQADPGFQGNVAELHDYNKSLEWPVANVKKSSSHGTQSGSHIDLCQLGLNENKSRSGLTWGGVCCQIGSLHQNGKLCQITILSAARNAIAVNEPNAKNRAWFVHSGPQEVLAVSLPFSYWKVRPQLSNNWTSSLLLVLD